MKCYFIFLLILFLWDRGRRFYETTNANFLGVFPCVRTVEKKLKKFDTSPPEGQLNIAPIKQYLLENNLPLVVSLSEDATSVVGRREYKFFEL